MDIHEMANIDSYWHEKILSIEVNILETFNL